jgi:hypothetical protein
MPELVTATPGEVAQVTSVEQCYICGKYYVPTILAAVRRGTTGEFVMACYTCRETAAINSKTLGWIPK